MSALLVFSPQKPHTLGALLDQLGMEAPPGADVTRLVRRVAPLDRAGRDDLTCFVPSLEPDELAATEAGFCLIGPADLSRVPKRTVGLLCENPAATFALAARLLHPGADRPGATPGASGHDPSARIDRTARLETDVTIEAGAIIGPQVEIGRGSFIGAYAVLGSKVKIGRQCVIDAQTSLFAALIGDRVNIQAGARLGTGGLRDQLGLAPQALWLGRVIVQDDVEIGANAIIARGRLGDTVIGEFATIRPSAVVPSDMTVPRRTLF
jgi:UDP-3-O-[3-hydroxymyristoyl] glucosamine N-acyltransferase